MGYKVVVVGATGNVGREMLNILAEREFPVDEIAALASRRQPGHRGELRRPTLKTQDLDTFDFTGWDIALFAIGSDATKKYAPKAAKAGCVVIDNSSLYRYDPDVPLVVPEVNPEAVEGYAKKNIIANPNCSTAQMVVALKPLHDRARSSAWWSHLPVGLGLRQGGDGRALGPDQGRLQPTDESSRRSTPSRSPSTSSRISTSFWRTARPRKNGRWSPRPRRSSTPRSRSPRPACGCRSSSAMPRRSTSSSRSFSTRTRPATSCARARGSWSSTSARTAAMSRRSNAWAISPPSSAASGRTRRSTTA